MAVAAILIILGIEFVVIVLYESIRDTIKQNQKRKRFPT